MIAPPSFRSGRAFLTVKASPRVLIAKTLSKRSSVVSASGLGVDDPSAGEEDVELAFSLAELRVEPVEIGEV
jgi:hypothetical protein